ncbi:leucyl aminopeptidase [Rhodobacter sp. KR11]|uniref:leucyl aminopeptidase n=1 Tax=Rhodobacter sp. KR11 TaxID=2974588 RepID=UPI002223BEF4|nr:leucyl aminopeptidase [Rhodobacter sp. KR11]MCW1919545.1 leucyl aminopeptidase [Rhodobacter sp. KR11]
MTAIQTAALTPALISFDLETLATVPGRIALFVEGEVPRSLAARRLDRLSRGMLSKAMGSEAWGKVKPGEALELAHLPGLVAEAVQLIRLPKKATSDETRKAGASVTRARGKADILVLAEGVARLEDLFLGLMLRAYDFTTYKTGEQTVKGAVNVSVPEGEAALEAARAVAEGVIFTRDLVNEPANVLTTMEFAERLTGLRDLGVHVEVLDEEELERLGMRLLLGVGVGSECPSKVVVMTWKGSDAEPFALVGKGVCFDTGGISIKPAGGMEEMTMDMGGAGVVAGVMKTLALRKAKAHVVGLVGLVENMPDGRATRPGDIIRSMKGDTVEVINTDAEGRLVLADVLWYAQERFKPTGIINLATLTGAIIVALGSEHAGVFSNDDALCGAFLKAAAAESEGAWRMPMGPAYDEKLKSRLADMMNVGGREGGAITAAQFIKRFIKEGQAWVHLDIAGVTLGKGDTGLAPKGATGWGVRSLNRLVADLLER